ncbi:DNA methyltransferase [Pseudomonas sp.]|uniref:DNA methyltransferase n=1 Tax=Pseudomonas sp. TaxID=306 RepID=UPI0025855E03|nr:DNA methyltransferase [Pseudomonas sp.]
MADYTLHLGDCLDVMRTLPDNSVDSVVTDPPYAFPGGFMAKEWDNFDGREDAGFGYWLAGFTDGEGHFRVQKHERGSHTCVFQIKTRDDDRSALERIKHFLGVGVIYSGEGSGNANPQCAYIVQDKEGCARIVALFRKYPLTAKKALDFEIWAEAVEEWLERPRGNRWTGMSDQARAASLKARLEDVRRYTGIPWSGHKFQDWVRQWATECLRVLKPGGHLLAFGSPRQYHRLACGIEDAGFEIRDQILWIFGSGFPKSHNLKGDFDGYGTALKPAHEPICMARKPLTGTVAESQEFTSSEGSAARFFYCAKTSRTDRHEGMLNPGPQFKQGTTLRDVQTAELKGNTHPTVKPTDLMAYLLRLVTPPGGLTLDPFVGSGSTGKAAMLEGFNFIGIDNDKSYLAIAEARILYAQQFAKDESSQLSLI